MTILSFDVGKNNLSYCVMNNETIFEWVICSFNNIQELINILDNINLENITIVLIEQQPTRNIQMFKIMNYIEFYFNYKTIETKLMSGKLKLKPYKEELNELIKNCKTKNKGAQYRCRKKLSVIITKREVEEKHKEWLEYFIKTKKKDDLGDCYLQGKYYLNIL